MELAHGQPESVKCPGDGLGDAFSAGKVNASQEFAQVVLARTLLVLAMSFPGWANAAMSKGETQLEGLRVDAFGVSRPTGPQGLYCNVEVSFSGPRIFPDGKVTSVRVLRAVDDLGRDLLTTNANEPGNVESFGKLRLKNPLPDAKSIELDGEVELRIPTVPRLIFTNAAVHLGQTLKHPLLDLYQIKITTLDPETWPGRRVGLHWEDPLGKLIGIGFQNRNRSEVFEKSETEFLIGTNKIVSYEFGDIPVTELDMVVRLNVPYQTKTTTFKIRSIPLPWVQPAKLEPVYVEALTGKNLTNEYCLALVDFKGGPLTNGAGIRNVSITKAEGAASEDLTTGLTALSPYGFESPDSLEQGGIVRKVILLHTKSSPLNVIKHLEGDVEVFYLSDSNLTYVNAGCELNAGEKITDPKLDEQGVHFTFVGAQNFKVTKKQLEKSDGFVWQRPLIGAEVSETAKDSLLFSYEDPRQVLLSHSTFDVGFLDSQNRQVEPTDFVYTPKFYLLRFHQVPRIAGLTFYLINKADIRHIHFSAENIPVR